MKMVTALICLPTTVAKLKVMKALEKMKGVMKKGLKTTLAGMVKCVDGL